MKLPAPDLRSAARSAWAAIAARRRELLVAVVLFFVAFGFRTSYVGEAVVETPLRADAYRYFSLAYDLYFFGDYSEEPPLLRGGRIATHGREASDTRGDTAAGYPLFLTLFISDGKHAVAFLNDVISAQVIIGSLTAVMIFVLARFFLSLWWASFAGMLTAMSPHLIVLDGLLLSETLFTFVIVLGVLLLTIAWRSGYIGVTFVASLLLALSSQVRTLGLFLLAFVGPVLFVRPDAPQLQSRRTMTRQTVAAVAGILVAIAVYQTFVAVAVHNTETAVETGVKRASLARTDEWVVGTVFPPKYYMQGKSHVYAGDNAWIKPTQYGFWDEPLAYLSWNLFSKYVVTWNWNNLWNGDVYIYPMRNAPFNKDASLLSIYMVMRLLHWPVFIAGMIGLAYLSITFLRGTMPIALRPGLVAALALLYFVAVLSLVGLVPRYSIPARPFLFIFAAFGFSCILRFLREPAAKP